METLRNMKKAVLIIGVIALALSAIFGLVALDDEDALIGLFFVSPIIVLCIDYLISLEFYEVAIEKGFENTKYFWWCFILGALGFLLVVALPDRKETVKTYSDDLPEL